MPKILLPYIIALLFCSSLSGSNISTPDDLLLHSAFDDTLKLSSLIDSCMENRKNDLNASISLSKKIVELAKNTGSEYLLTRAYINQGIRYLDAHEFDSARITYLFADTIVRQHSYPMLAGQIYNGFGMINREQGKLCEAIDQHFVALNYFNESKDSFDLITTYRHLGLAYSHIGKYNLSLENNLKAARIAERGNFNKQAAYAYNNIAVQYILQGKHAEALPYQLKAQKMIAKYNYIGDNYMIHNNLAIIYAGLNMNDLSLQHYTDALDLAYEMEDTHRISQILLNISVFSRKAGEYKKAEEYVREALKLSHENHHQNVYVDACSALASIYSETGRTQLSIDLLEASLIHAKASDYNAKIARATKQLSENYASLGNYKAAYENHLLHKSISDSLVNEDKIKEFTRLEMQYDFEIKEQETAFLNQQQLLQREHEINNQKTMRNFAFLGLIMSVILATVLLYTHRVKAKAKEGKLQQDLFLYRQRSMSQQMNPHFIFNTLNSIQYFLDQNERKEGMKYVSKFAQLMRTALYNSEKATVPLADEIEIVKLYVELEALRLTQELEFNVNIPEDIDPEHFQVPSFLLQPLIENSIKHGISQINEKGIINLNILRQENCIKFEVIDNGIGLNGSRSSAEMNHVGKTHKSVATSLTRKRLNLLGLYYNQDLSFKLSDLKHRGTQVELEIPLIYS